MELVDTVNTIKLFPSCKMDSIKKVYLCIVKVHVDRNEM